MNEFFRQSRRAFRALHGLQTEPSGTVSTEDSWFDIGRRHRVVGLWMDSPDHLTVGEPWHRYACGQLVHSTRLTIEAGRLIGLLTDSVEGLRMIKGPILGAQAWPHPDLRSFDDLDFRCTKQSLGTLMSGMKKAGYKPFVENVCRMENLWTYGWGVEFRHPDGFIAEFNHRMFPPHYPWPEQLTWNTPEGWASIDVDQHTVDGPVPALHLILACMHAEWHGWERIGWLVDIAGLLVRYPGIYAKAEALAERYSFAKKALQCGCHVANHLFGPLLEFPDQDGTPDRYESQALAILTQSHPEVTFGIRRKVHYQMMSPVEAMHYTVRRIITPGDVDFQKWQLTGRARACYRILRPLRLLVSPHHH
ncbi:MAG: nucleotidyltransferase family protein [Kiritimatiellaceae bacterium]|nr:nucleotidyltransferase family protein [Kiritimatiellaceae bacterium]